MKKSYLIILLLIPCWVIAAKKTNRQCNYHAVIPQFVMKPFPSVLQDTVRDYLPKAIEGKRLIGMETEFGGLTTQAFLEDFASHTGGTLDGGMVKIKPDTKFEKVFHYKYPAELEEGQSPTITIELKNGVYSLFGTAIPEEGKSFKSRSGLESYLQRKVDKKLTLSDFGLEDVMFKLDATDGKSYDFRLYPDWDVLYMPDEDFVEGLGTVRGLNDWVKKARGREVVTRPMTMIRGTALGNIRMHTEPIGRQKTGIELVTDPFPSGDLGKYKDVYRFLSQKGAQGTPEKFAAAVHVNIGVKDGENVAQITRRLILKWHERRKNIISFFEPSDLRRSTIDNNRPFYGDYSKGFLEDLKALGESVTEAQILALYPKHYPDIDPAYYGKWFDVNPIYVLRGKQKRFEFRLFNSDFREGQEEVVKHAMEFCVSAVEEASRQEVP